MAKVKNTNDLSHRLETLQQVTVGLMTIRNTRELLGNILNQAVDLLICDAGSLYIRHGERDLVFEISVNRTIAIDLERRVVPSDSQGLAAHCFRSGETMNFADVYSLPAGTKFSFDPSVDKQTGYRTRSVLVIPLVSSKGETLGVLQLINRKHQLGEEWPSHQPEKLAKMREFDEDDLKLSASFGALAAAALENSMLYENIQSLFEGFVYAAVGAIESRDRATRGHSERVAILTVDLARRVSDSNSSELREIRFTDKQLSEVRYAALLHDFGKIGVREQTLMKSEKLFPHQTGTIRSRLNEFSMVKEIHELRNLLETLMRDARAPLELDLASVDRTIRKFKNKVDEHWDTILDLNQPTVLDEDKMNILDTLKSVELMAANGQVQRLLQPNEVAALSIRRGSLSVEERKEIEEHVSRTFLFLKEIPWTKDFKDLAEIAHAHHEKLDGSGYPRRLEGDKIPNQSRIMTICDIFDALVASDRPYKRAVPTEKALMILEDEVKTGKLDGRFFKVFKEARVFENLEFVALAGQPVKKAA